MTTVRPPSEILAAATGYLRRNYDQELTLPGVAAAIPVSPYYLAHLFRREAGTTFLTYLTDIRLRRARALLAGTELPVCVVAMRVGFRSAERFRVLFRRAFDTSPTAYRAAHRTRAGTRYHS